MKIKTLILLCSFVSITSLLIAQDSTWVEEKDSLYSIRYPEDWLFQLPGLQGTTFQIYNFQESNTDPFIENVSLVITDFPDSTSYSNYINLFLGTIPKDLEEGYIIDTTRVSNPKYDYFEVEYSGLQNEVKLHFIKRFYKLDNTLFILTGVFEQSKKEKYRNLLWKIMESFKIEV